MDAVIDTGFDGWLSLSSSQIANLGLPFRSRGRAMLADGSEQLVDMHEGRVIWDDETIRIVVDAAETAPLIGMSLMHGFRLTADIVEGGEVTIERL
ncbi:MAG TPA: clan AA aspartic protease [Vicinamibacteria bacterium]|nr:clan AA aspartic protease [Vicinamibacteria bacterium]